VKFFDLLDHFHFLFLAIENYEDYRSLFLLFKIAEKVIAQVGQRDAFTMEVSEFFHFKGSFLGDAISYSLSTEENMAMTFQLKSNFLRFLINHLQSFFDVGRKHF
jgi:hypothetical protein